jgi:hypothetical protein
MHRDDLTDARSSRLARVARRLDRSHVAADHSRHVSAAGFFVRDQFDFGGFDHRVGRFHHRGKLRHSIMPSASAMIGFLLVRTMPRGVARGAIHSNGGYSDYSTTLLPCTA